MEEQDDWDKDKEDAKEDFEAATMDAKFAKKVVNELYERYNQLRDRRRDYCNLMFFLIFVTFNLSILYLQRDAESAYSVVSTITRSSLIPTDTEVSDTADILSWLQTLLQDIWEDPVCGDDKCEDPFEFAFYGRFGCKADCGTFLEQQEITEVQVDLYYDFHHASGSTPPTTLMQDSSWNLCPAEDSSFFEVYHIKNSTKIKHGSACYWESDNTFDQLTGHRLENIPDVPDGEWELVVKGDLFNKVGGAVRHRGNVTYYSKRLKYLAAYAVANYQLGAEYQILNNTWLQIDKTDSQIVMEYIESIYETEYNLLNASLDGGQLNYSDYLVEMAALTESYEVSVSDAESTFNDQCVTLREANSSVLVGDFNETTGELYCGSGCFSNTVPYLWNTENVTVGANISLCTSCNDTIDEFCSWADDTVSAYKDAIRDNLLNLDSQIADAGDDCYDVVMDEYLILHRALHYEIYEAKGTDPSEPDEASTATIVDDFIARENEQSEYKDGLSQRSVANNPYANISADVYGRFKELEDHVIHSEELLEADSSVPPDAATTYETYAQSRAQITYTMTTEDIKEIIVSVLPNRSMYTYVEWEPLAGSTTEYMTCDLDNRSPQYFGTCVNAAYMTQLAYNETYGYLTAEDMEEKCEKLCYCPWPICNEEQVCACVACGMEEDEAEEYIDHTLQTRKLQELRRKLLNASTEEMYQELLTAIQDLSTQQDDLSAQVTDVQVEQERQNAAAEAHHADTSLETTINAGFSDLKASYDILQDQMNELLEKQDKALEETAKTEEQLKRIEELGEQQNKALDSIKKAVDKQINEINKAYEQNQIDYQARKRYYFNAELDELEANKKAELSNLACTVKPKEFTFELDNYPDSTNDSARERLVGINNKVVAGMLMYVRRNVLAECNNTRFSNIENYCIAGMDPGHSYGVDPVFKLGEDLYNADLDYEETITKYYNCSELRTATYTDKNTVPYCTQYYNDKLVPWGYFSYNMKGHTSGFPVFFDINLSQDRAQDYYLYVEEGHYIEESETKDITVHLVTYNAELKIFANIQIWFRFLVAGKITISYNIQAVKVELYVTFEDKARGGMEVGLAIFAICALVIELNELYTCRMKYGTVKVYFRSAWNYIDLTSIGIQIVCVIYWWLYVFLMAERFDVSKAPGGRYDVYNDLEAKARFLRLAGNCGDVYSDEYNEANDCANAGAELQRGYGLEELAMMLNKMDKLGAQLSFYMTLSGINIILMIARSLKLMDFQPRLGIVTKTLALAASDILHFMVVFGVVFMGYVMMGTLVFGYKIQEFSSLLNSLQTCFETLLGEIGWNNALQDLKGLEYWAGFAYFWSYQILVFMILLNFLLAIIVDAYAEIKDAAHETVSVPAEVYPMLKEKWRTLLKSKYFYRKHIPEDRIRKSLKVLAGRGDEESSDDSSHDFNFDAEKFLKVGDEDIDRETLTRVLTHCIAYAEEKAGVYDIAQKETPPSEQTFMDKLTSCLPNKFKKGGGLPPLFTTQDVHGAVDMLMEQHGEPKKKEDEGEEEEEEEDVDTKEMMEKMAELIRGQEALMSGQKKLEDLEERLLKAIELPSAAPEAAAIRSDDDA